MLKLGNFQSCVLIENEAATEYNVQYSADGSLASCWIASELGKAFIISWTYTSQHDQHFGGRLLIDGEDMIRAFCPPTTAPRTIQLGHKITSKNTLRPFTFAAIHLTDDDSYLDAPQPSSLGNIKLEIWRLHQPTSDTPLAVSEDEGCISERIVHERAKKIASHRVKLGAPVPTQQRWTTAQASCTDKQPVATFEFMYRTRGKSILCGELFEAYHFIIRRIPPSTRHCSSCTPYSDYSQGRVNTEYPKAFGSCACSRFKSCSDCSQDGVHSEYPRRDRSGPDRGQEIGARERLARKSQGKPKRTKEEPASISLSNGQSQRPAKRLKQEHYQPEIIDLT
ncbi:hypothetical protein HGRIS_004564 [Hohenbuehelia grisea]|uniref:DUF7918 domain-containing protein n=1 Tax=Hohenbuehelia grisea TaxID=104357 RepID=A0ABR3JD31_9AGAR